MKRLLTLALVIALVVAFGLCSYFFRQNIQLKQEIASLNQRMTNATDALNQEVTRYKKEKEAAEQRLAAALSNAGMTPNQVASAISASRPRQVPEEPATEMQKIAASQLDQNVSRKYELLLRMVTTSGDQEEKLVALLRERERVLNMSTHSYYADDLDLTAAVTEQEELLSKLDDQIAQLMDSESADRYELLKDSGFEQYQIREFDNSLSGDAFLSTDQTDSLLMAKLRHKQAYMQELETAEQLISQGKKNEGIKGFQAAVSNYKSAYFQEAQSILNPEQFEKLKSYEAAQFDSMISSLVAPHLDD